MEHALFWGIRVKVISVDAKEHSRIGTTDNDYAKFAPSIQRDRVSNFLSAKTEKLSYREMIL